jgi:mutator protein MutT
MIEVAKSLIKKNEKYLLLKRSSDSKFFPGLWDFPGGKIEPREDVTEALIREAKEETSLEIIPQEKIGDFDYIENDTPVHFQIFSVKNFSGDIKLSQDHSEFIWLSIEGLSKYDLAAIVKLFFNITNQ